MPGQWNYRVRLFAGMLCLLILFISASGCRQNGAGSPPVLLSVLHPPKSPFLFRDTATLASIDFRLGHATRQHVNILDSIGHGCAFIDYDGDGRLDILLVGSTQPRLYHNLGKGKFADVTLQALPSAPANAHFLGCAIADYDSDGRFDLLVANYANQPRSLYHNEGRYFVNAAYTSGLATSTIRTLAFGAAFIDYDNDGWPDIVFTNGHVQTEVEKIDSTATYFQSAQLLHNLGNGRFTDVSIQAGSDFTQPIVGRGVATGDYDNDGYPDLLMVNDEGRPLLLHNEERSGNHWLTLPCLQGQHKWDAIGAHVTIMVGERKQIAEVRAGGSYLSASAPEVHFGLGKAKVVNSVKIRWPDGHTSLFHAVAADHSYQAFPKQNTLTALP